MEKKKLETLNKNLFNEEMHNYKNTFGGFCCTIAGCVWKVIDNVNRDVCPSETITMAP